MDENGPRKVDFTCQSNSKQDTASNYYMDNSQISQMRRRKKKKKKKKVSTFHSELDEQGEVRGLSEILPITIKRNKDEINIELQLEEIQNENFTELH